MTRQWNGQELISILGRELWNDSSAFRERIKEFIQEIQDDLVSTIPQEHFKFKLKKLLTMSQNIMNLDIEVPTAPTTALAADGSLTNGTAYKVYVTFVVYDEDTDQWMESMPSLAGTERTGTAANKTIDLTDIDLLDGTTTILPATIYRNI